MAKAGITQFGDKKFELAIDRFEQKYISEIKRVVAETAEMMVSEAKANAPVDTGALRNSINVDYDREGLTATIHVDADYAIYCEYGTGIFSTNGSGRKTPWVYYDEKLGHYVYTHGMKAQPFFRPAYEKAAQHFKSEMNKLG